MFSAFSFAQNGKSLWSKTSQNQLSKKAQVFRKTQPIKANYYQLNIDGLQQLLQNAPERNTNVNSNVIISFPTADDTFESFRVTEASVMHPELQNKYPNIRSYSGQSIDNPGSLIRFSITTQGLHAMFLAPGRGTEYIDPYTKADNNYIVYSKKDLPTLDQPWECGVIDGGTSIDEKTLSNSYQLRDTGDGMMRDFRTAVATTIEYSEFHWLAAGLTAGDTEAAKRTAVMAAIVVTMTRNNFLYERDFSITMTLVANNDLIVFINSDNFSNTNANALIGESQVEIDAAIGNSNYDLGHTFSTGGGGLATLNSPCNNSTKARGITGLGSPVGDAYDVDFVAHELGHQFGAPHTFNGTMGNCSGANRTASNAYEVGSGTTIMAYAGICGSDNVQSNSDAYFHQKSLQMIWDNVNSGVSTCATQTPTGNGAPTSEAGVNYTIPSSTPYKLTGSSTDSGTDTSLHTYTWEQYDLGQAGLPADANPGGPMVRSFEGTTDPTRYIPRLPDLYNSAGASTTWEKLASTSRDLNFRLTVRDNDANGGRTAVDGMTATTVAAAGPFLVTSQTADQLVWTPGNTETITWDVAGTTANGVDTANVNILLSTDQGVTYTTVLASNVPNDGSHDITVPNVEAPFCRIMVEGAGNIFFNVNEKFFAVGDYTYVLQPETCTDYPFNAGIPVVENGGSYTGYNLNIPDSRTISDVNINVNITSANNSDLWYAVRAPWQPAGLQQLASGICAGSANTDLTFDDEGAAVDCGSTNNGDNVIPQVALSFADGQDAQGTWVFFLTDVVVDGTTSTWNSTTITICEQETIPVLAVDQFNLETTFSVYPNPNNGEFTIKFSGASGNVDLQVYDIRGRSVFNKNYTETGDFNQNINLGNVQSGMYILNVNDGSKTVTKKIIVQ